MTDCRGGWLVTRRIVPAGRGCSGIRSNRFGVSQVGTEWETEYIVPFFWDFPSSLSSGEIAMRKVLTQHGIDVWERHACLKFREFQSRNAAEAWTVANAPRNGLHYTWCPNGPLAVGIGMTKPETCSVFVYQDGKNTVGQHDYCTLTMNLGWCNTMQVMLSSSAVVGHIC